MQVTLQHHFASNAHAYRLLIIKEHRKTLIYSSFCAADLSAAKKRDSNLLFASLSNVFENFFSQHLSARLPPSKHLASSAAKRRDFDLLFQLRQALFEKFLKHSTNRTSFRTLAPPSHHNNSEEKPRAAKPSILAQISGRRQEIVEDSSRRIRPQRWAGLMGSLFLIDR